MNSPEVWGPMFHISLHWIFSRGDVPGHVKVSLFNLVGEVVPCNPCRHNWVKHSEGVTVRGSNVDLVYIQMHNKINRMHNKREYTYHEARDLIAARQPEENANAVFGMLFYIASSVAHNPHNPIQFDPAYKFYDLVLNWVLRKRCPPPPLPRSSMPPPPPPDYFMQWLFAAFPNKTVYTNLQYHNNPATDAAAMGYAT